MMRIMGIDPGEKRTGFAISDPTQTIASPFLVYQQKSRNDLVDKILQLVQDKQVETVVIGQALDAEGGEGYQARRSRRLADAVRTRTQTPVILWDESHTTQEAIRAQQLMQTSRKRKKNSLDSVAAALILQSYLDSQRAGLFD